MADLSSSGATVHPIGWTFLGAGGLAWAWPLADIIRPGLAWAVARNVSTATIAVFGITLFGACVDFALGTWLEPKLFKWRKMCNPTGEQWAAAWRTRWASSTADSEFRRHEGMVSLARTYIVHSALAGVMWGIVVGLSAWTLAVIVVSLLLVWFFVRMWHRYTFQILLIVVSAAKWEDRNAPRNGAV